MLAASVDMARYWQEPDGHDLLAAQPELRPPLLRVAEVVAASEAAAWWGDPYDRANQRLAVPGGGGPPSDVPAAQQLAAWRRGWPERQPAPDAALRGRARDMAGGDWGSAPHDELRRTARQLAAWAPVGFHWVEDGFGWERFAVSEVRTAPGPVLEIDGPDDRSALCLRFPIDLGASTQRRHWLDVTGQDRRWVMPDWSAVAAEHAAVHLAVLGSLRTATRLVEPGGGRDSVLGGWNPDETIRLRDGTREVGDPVVWSHSEPGGWTPQPG